MSGPRRSPHTLDVRFKSNERPFHSVYDPSPCGPADDAAAVEWALGMANTMGGEHTLTLLKDGVPVPLPETEEGFDRDPWRPSAGDGRTTFDLPRQALARVATPQGGATMSETQTPTKSTFRADDCIPIEMWGRDHWSTLAYAVTQMVECSGFQVGFDPRMRANRRHFRVMWEECPRPKRSAPATSFGYGPLPVGKYGTRLADGSEVDGHDDWCCLQDMAKAGLFAALDEGGAPRPCDDVDVQPGAVLRLSPLGLEVAAALRAHKIAGGGFAAFRWPPAAPGAAATAAAP